MKRTHTRRILEPPQNFLRAPSGDTGPLGDGGDTWKATSAVGVRVPSECEHGVLFQGCNVQVEDVVHPSKGLPDWFRTLPQILDLRETLAELGKNLIKRALEQANGVQPEAARMLGLSRSDMGYKVTKYAIE